MDYCLYCSDGRHQKKKTFRTSKSIVVPKKLLVLGFVLLHSEQRTKQRAHAQKARGRIHTLTAAQERGPKRKHFQVANTNLACRAPRSDHTRGDSLEPMGSSTSVRDSTWKLYMLFPHSKEMNIMNTFLSLTNPNA